VQALQAKQESVMAQGPVFFISHGAPSFALEPGELGHALQAHSLVLQNTPAIVALSPHWQTKGIRVTNCATPETIHDFYGFEPALYDLVYSAVGSQAIARQVVAAFTNTGLSAELDQARGMDHGVWVPLLHLRRAADIPVVCVSLPLDATPASSLQIGQALAALRTQGVAIMASGSLTHNLGEFRGTTQTLALPYVHSFAAWVREKVRTREVNDLLAYRQLAPEASRAHPTEEHFLPLFVAMGASQSDDQMTTLTTEVRHGMLSMESYLWQ
jgi:4,5-DOPA dioxygenase extradiol